MSWEKGNHSKDELLQGKADQAPSSDPLLPVLSTAPHRCSLNHVGVQQLSSGGGEGSSLERAKNEPARASETAAGKEGRWDTPQGQE